MSIIKKLDESVVNKIAAGEVIQRPSSAVKELIENSIDAGSTSITLIIKGGGLQLIQIQDNGHGIHKDDLTTVCNRFTTSKLSEYEDLRTMSTFGFRGEALASITYVSKVSITSKTPSSSCAYKARYLDGDLIPWDSSSKLEPKPCAGLNGTIIVIEDMFYNVSVRRKSFQNANEEYQRILDVVAKYSILYGDKGVSFVCKKHGQSIPDLLTTCPTTSKENIGRAYGYQISKELIHVAGDSKSLEVSIAGEITNSSYSGKGGVYIIFVNNRLVEHSPIRKVIDGLYHELFAQQIRPFVYLNIRMPPENIDVNVHPTKKEVHFLHEDEILKLICDVIEPSLRATNQSRRFGVQDTLSSFFNVPVCSVVENVSKSNGPSSSKPSVRVDASLQKIGSFYKPMSVEHESQQNCNCCAPGMFCGTIKKRSRDTETSAYRQSRCDLDSIRNLRRRIDEECDSQLQTIFGGCVFIGNIDSVFSLVQLDSKMLLINHKQALYQLCYQCVIANFADLKEFKIDPPIDIYLFILKSVQMIECEVDGHNIESIALSACEALVDRRQMLCDYFSIRIDENGFLTALPLLFDTCPNLDGVPFFLKDLAIDTDWTSELQCFQNVAKLIAKLYSHLVSDSVALRNMLDSLYFPLLKSPNIFKPSCNFPIDIYPITELENLYKIFERC